MKSLSNTFIAALIAVVLTVTVAALPHVSFFGALETQASDQMMKLAYNLHKKYSPIPPDHHLVFAAIDEQSVEALGRWPFPRNVHAQFLDVLAPEKPKVVGWDILFTESSSPSASISTPSVPSPAAPGPDSSGSTPPSASTPSATSTTEPGSIPAPTATPASPPAHDTSGSAPTPPASPDAANGGTLPTKSDDEAFAESAAALPHVVTGAKREDTAPPLNAGDFPPTRPLKNVIGDISKLYSSKSALLPFPALRKKSYFGFVDEQGDNGGARRNMPLVVNVGGMIFPSLDFQIVLQYWDVDPDKVIVNLGYAITVLRTDGTQIDIPIDERGCMLINYRARLEDFVAGSYIWIAKGLADKANGQQSDERNHLPPIKDNIVVIGVTIAGTDAGVTPIDLNSPLVDTHLNVLNNILQHDFVRPLSPLIWMPVYALFIFVTGNLMLRVGIAPMIPMGLLSLLLVAGVVLGALLFANLQIPVASPEIGILLLAGIVPTKRFFGEEREKLRIRSAMSAYLSEKVMTQVLAHPDNVKLGGVKQEITIMFCDIRGFTKYCDNRDSAEVLSVLNEYMEEMTQVVFKYDGTVDKYIGDCIMAFWNAPGLQPDHAQRAVCCAMEMRYALANFKTKRAGKDTELFECGIGIHTGEALVGNMGSSLKRNYTAMGSSVNLGARLESLTKRLNERILISQATRDQLQGDFPLTDRGEALVPGFTNPIHVYAVGAEQDISSALKVGRTVASQQDYTAEEVTAPIWEPAPLPKDADPEP